MYVIDPGHSFELDRLDSPSGSKALLIFVKREGPGYPGNVGNHPGTNMQEVIRALISRAQYVDGQVSCTETQMVIENLRSALLLLELRAARRHGRLLDLKGVKEIESLPTCKKCGHIGCEGKCHE